MKSDDVIEKLKYASDPERAKHSLRFFKTGVGEYGEGDIFWGLTVPETREIAKHFKEINLDEIKPLIHHEVHEVRLCSIYILTTQYKKSSHAIYDFYINNLEGVNNWDLVDSSASYIVGAYLFDKDRAILYVFAQSDNLWKRRIAIVATHYFIRKGEHKDTFEIARLLLTDKHDLIHKAVGWMLREVGKNCGIDVLKRFLDTHASSMPRTMLRYSIEHLKEDERQHYLNQKTLPDK